jgi:tetratricopeptide (TPR) repeat protein
MTPSARFNLISALLLAALFLAGCSAEGRKVRFLADADRYFADQDYPHAEVEYLNVLKLEPRHARAIAQLGIIYSDGGRLGRGVAYLMEAHQLDPENLEVRIKLAQFRLASGLPQDARDQVNFVLSRRPGDADAPLLLAATIAKIEDVDIVRQALQSLPAPAPAGAPVLVGLAAVEMRLNRVKEANALLERARSVDPKLPSTYSLLGQLRLAAKDTAGADAAFKQAADLSPLRSPHRLQYAQFKQRTDGAGAARQVLEDVVKRAPDYIPALINLAEIAFLEAKYEESAGHLKKVLSQDTDNFAARLLTARITLATGKIEEGIAELEKLATAFPRVAAIQSELGRAYVSAGDLGKAADSLTQTLRLAPGHIEATVTLAGIQMKRGDNSAAVVLLRRLVQQQPDIPQAWLLLAEALRAVGSLDEAVAIYRQFEQQFPQESQTSVSLGLVLLAQNKLPEAREAFQRAFASAPGNVSALEQLVNLDLNENKFGEARRRIEEAVAKTPALLGPAQLLLAKSFLKEKKFDEAETALKKAVELMPENQTAYLLLAGLYSSTNRIPEALAQLDQAIARNPKDVSALTLSGIIKDQQQDFEAARISYEKLLEANPRSIVALNNLAYLYSEKFNQLDKALDFAQKAQVLWPSDPRVADTLGWILYQNRQYARALALLREAASRMADNPEVLYHLGMTYYMTGDEVRARDTLRRALANDGSFNGAEAARQALALLELDLENSSARASLESAAKDRPGDPIILAKLALLDERAGRVDEAIASLEAALKVNDRNVSILSQLTRLHARRKDTTAALNYAKAARQLAPDDPVVAQTLGKIAFDLGDQTWSVSLFQESLQKQDPNADLLFDYAQALYSVGRLEDAITNTDNALKIARDQPLVIFPRQREAEEFRNLLAAFGDPGRAAAVTTQVEALLRANPNFVPALMLSGMANEQRGDTAAAQEIYEKVLALYPEFLPAKLRSAIVAASLLAKEPSPDSKVDQVTFNRALQARAAYPNDATMAKALGILTLRRGEPTRAIPLLKEATVRRSADAEAWYFLGEAYLATDDTAAGRESLQKALQLNLAPALATEANRLLGKG